MEHRNAQNAPYQPVTCRLLLRDGTAQSAQAPLLREQLIRLTLNGQPWGELSCTPGCLEELVLGRLCTRGYISTPRDVSSLTLRPEEGRADVVLVRAAAQRPLRPVAPIPWTAPEVFALSDAFYQGAPLYEITRGAHCCLIAVGGRLLCLREDLSRHNALDKAVGEALKLGADLTRAMLYTSGRAPADMLLKAIRARIPVFVSKGAPTAQAAELARQYQVVLVGNAHRDSLRQYWP